MVIKAPPGRRLTRNNLRAGPAPHRAGMALVAGLDGAGSPVRPAPEDAAWGETHSNGGRHLRAGGGGGPPALAANARERPGA
jgi:hypothetical protein